MKELIKIKTNENNEQIVSCRELHEKLEVNTRYNDWFTRMCDYGFVENVDYIALTQKRVTAQGNETTYTDHIIKLDMAKEICMIQRTEIGKKFRQYFIECEKRLSTLNVPSYQIADPIERAKKWIEEEQVRQMQAKKIENDRPLVEFADHVSESVNSIDFGTFAKLLYDENINLGRNKLFQWMKKHKYLMHNNVPYQQYVDAHYFEVIEQTYKTPYGEKRIGTKTLITGKGQIYFTEKLRKEIIKGNELNFPLN